MQIYYSKNAVKFLEKQSKDTQRRIIVAIEKLPSGDIVKLHGLQGYRLRVGDIGIIYVNNGELINIISIGFRGGVYK